MKKRRLGQSDVELTVLTMGCWQAGKSGWSGVEDEETIAAIRAAYDGGITAFDTAEAYGEGYSERILAKSVGEHRDEIIIATKVAAHHLKASQVKEACERSLKNLETDRIDLYQIHWPSGTFNSPVVPIEETMGALNELKEEGKIRAIGVSNFNAAQIEEALKYGRIDSLQPPYSLFWRIYENNGTVAACVKNEIGIIPYSPLAQGLLTGKFNLDNRPTDDNRKGNTLFQDPIYQTALQAVADLEPIAHKNGKTTGQLALQWLLHQQGVTSVIVGARNAEQVKDNLAAAQGDLSEEDLQEIERIGRTVTGQLPDEQTSMWG